MAWVRCDRCGIAKDDVRSRRGTSARRLGGDQERRIERVYGPRKVGEHGDAIDLLGRDFAWQSKATRQPPAAWLSGVDSAGLRFAAPALVRESVAAMLPLLAHRLPLVIVSHVHQGRETRDWIWVRADDWHRLHGGGVREGWLVMSGDWFLAVNGRDV